MIYPNEGLVAVGGSIAKCALCRNPTESTWPTQYIYLNMLKQLERWCILDHRLWAFVRTCPAGSWLVQNTSLRQQFLYYRVRKAQKDSELRVRALGSLTLEGGDFLNPACKMGFE